MLGFGWDTAGSSPPTFNAFPLTSPPECSRASCPTGFASLEPNTNPDQIGNPFGAFASEAGAAPGVMGVFDTLFTNGPLGCAKSFGTAYAYGAGNQAATNDYNISPGSPNSAWRVPVAQLDCNVENPAVGGGPSGFGVLETDDGTSTTIYRRFNATTMKFDTPVVTVAKNGQSNGAVSQDGAGGVYATYMLGGSGGPVNLSYSADGGKSFATGVLDANTAGGADKVTSAVNAVGQGWADVARQRLSICQIVPGLGLHFPGPGRRRRHRQRVDGHHRCDLRFVPVHAHDHVDSSRDGDRSRHSCGCQEGQEEDQDDNSGQGPVHDHLGRGQEARRQTVKDRQATAGVKKGHIKINGLISETVQHHTLKTTAAPDLDDSARQEAPQVEPRSCGSPSAHQRTGQGGGHGMTMRWRTLRKRCLSHEGAQETFPFGTETSVFKVAGKLFALSRLHADPLSVSVKCDPLLAEQLRAAHPAITAGYHLNKRHWNTIVIDGSLPDAIIADMIEDSYDLVVSKLPKARQVSLGWALNGH